MKALIIAIGIVLAAPAALAEVSKFEQEMMEEVKAKVAEFGTDLGLASAYGTCLDRAKRRVLGSRYFMGFNKDRVAICDQISAAHQKATIGKGSDRWRYEYIIRGRATQHIYTTPRRYHHR